jgi:hypothetical protein
MTRIPKSSKTKTTRPDEFHRLKGDLTGEALIAVMQASPHRDIDTEPRRAPMPVREISL